LRSAGQGVERAADERHVVQVFLARRRQHQQPPAGEAPPEKGQQARPEFEAILASLPAELKPVFEVAYITGWRIKSETLTGQGKHLDLASGWLRLEPGETKNRKGRMFPLLRELRVVLERVAADTRKFEEKTGRVVPWLFHRQGERIRSFRRAWITACRRAGLAHVVERDGRTVVYPLRIPHDFRRTAVRNLERAGVPRSTAMAMVGHRTESIYRRYAIVDETMLREGAERLTAFYRGQSPSARRRAPGDPPAENDTASNTASQPERDRSRDLSTRKNGGQGRD
jgi:Phage integrase family